MWQMHSGWDLTSAGLSVRPTSKSLARSEKNNRGCAHAQTPPSQIIWSIDGGRARVMTMTPQQVGGSGGIYLPAMLRVGPFLNPTRMTLLHQERRAKKTPRYREQGNSGIAGWVTDGGSGGSSRGSEIKGLRGPAMLFEDDDDYAMSRERQAWSPLGRWRDAEPVALALNGDPCT